MAIAEVIYEARRERTHRRNVQAKERRVRERCWDLLTDAEILELQAVWRGSEELLGGGGSAHGSMEARLLRSAPRPGARLHILDELARAGGRAPEGRVVRIIAFEWNQDREDVSGMKTYEIKLAIDRLVQMGRVIRIAIPAPTNERELMYWTGYDLKLVPKLTPRVTPRGEVRMNLALARVPLTPEERAKRERARREERWRAQDEALRLMWHTIEPSGKDGGRKEPDDDGRAASPAARRALAALERISTRSAFVLRQVYGHEGALHALFGELGPIAELTPVVQAERQRRAEALARKRTARSSCWQIAMAEALRDVGTADVLRDWERNLQRIGQVRAEADELLRTACHEYRRARRRGGAR